MRGNESQGMATKIHHFVDALSLSRKDTTGRLLNNIQLLAVPVS